MVDPVKPSEDYSRDENEDAFMEEDVLDGGGAIFLGEAGEDFGTHFGGFEGSDDFDVYYDDGDDDEPLIGGVMNDTSHDAFNAGVNGGFFSATGAFHASNSQAQTSQSDDDSDVSLSEVSGEEGESSDFSEKT